MKIPGKNYVPNTRKINRIFIVLLAIFPVMQISCSRTEKKQDKPLAEVFGKTLYAGDIPPEVYSGKKGTDSVHAVKMFIDKWIREGVFLHFATRNTDTAYVLTTPPEAGQFLPNSPQHTFFAELNWEIFDKLRLTMSDNFVSKWAIYTDPDFYYERSADFIYSNWQEGYNLINAGLSYNFDFIKGKWTIDLSGRNLTGEKYIVFTEPDPDVILIIPVRGVNSL
jgi:hypothetical protein